MRLYELLKRISQIITPENDSFFRYVIYTSDDDGGFLRTRYCWWPDKPIEDYRLGDGYEKVMVTSKEKIDIEDFLDETDTNVKLQITYDVKNATVDDAEWDAQLGYCYVYIFDLIHNTYTVSYVENPLY